MNSSRIEQNNGSGDRVSSANTAVDIPLTTVTSTNPNRNVARKTNPEDTSSQPEITNGEEDVADRLISQQDVLSSLPSELNSYRNKKTLTQGLMDIALFSANANQLRYILDHSSDPRVYFYIAASLIIISLILQIGVGLLLLMSTQYSLSVECQREMVYKYGNYVVMGIFLITIVNVFIAAFGGPAVSTSSAVSLPLSSANTT